jgi:hypothetical protein
MSEEVKKGGFKVPAASPLRFFLPSYLEAYMQEYKTTFLWLLYGRHKTAPRPTAQETRQHLQALHDKISALISSISDQLRCPCGAAVLCIAGTPQRSAQPDSTAGYL